MQSKTKASLAQLVEHDTLNVGVLGSSPRGSTKKGRCSHLPFFVLGSSLLYPLPTSPEGRRSDKCIDFSYIIFQLKGKSQGRLEPVSIFRGCRKCPEDAQHLPFFVLGSSLLYPHPASPEGRSFLPQFFIAFFVLCGRFEPRIPPLSFECGLCYFVANVGGRSTNYILKDYAN